ncbi:helix-turn-helix transcriptional regulator [Fibrobacterota bacterium]
MLKNNNQNQEYLNAHELAHKLNMSLKWVVKHTQTRRIPGQIKVGRLWRYRKQDIEKALLKGQFLLPA